MKFDDGTDFTADAAAYNYNRILDPPKGTVPTGVFLELGVKKVTAPDKNTVKIEFEGPNGDFMDDFTLPTVSGGIACPGAYEKLIAAGKLPLFVEFTTTYGTGAFKPLE